MVVNQQLKDYVAQQQKLGVSKDAIKNALLGAGWNEADVVQAMTESGAAPQEVLSPKPVETSPVAASPVSPAIKSPISFVTSDIFQPKGEPVFQPQGEKNKSVAPLFPAKPEMLSAEVKVAAKGGIVMKVVLGVVSIILLGGNAYFFFQSNALQSEIDSSSKMATSLQSQVASLSGDKSNLTSEVDSLNKTITDLTNQLSIFAVPTGNATASVPFTIKGTIAGGGKSLYSLTTSKNILLTIKNSKDIDAALKLFVGKEVELAGTHQPGSSQLTVTTINGQSPQNVIDAASASSTSTPAGAAATSSASTTQPAATSSTTAP